MISKIKYILFLYLCSLSSSIFAAGDGGVLGGLGTGEDKDASAVSKLREGNIHIDDIPLMLKGAIDYLMGFAGTIAVIFIIVGAYKMALGSLEQDKAKGKTTVILALSGFALAALSWFILKVIIDNFS